MSENPEKRPRLRIYKSFEEERNDLYRYWASLTPEQRMDNMIDLIVMSFGLESDPTAYKNLDLKFRISNFKK